MRLICYMELYRENIMGVFDGVDLTKLFDNDSEYGKEYTFGEITEELIQRAEKKTGYKLSPAYIELLRSQNGGMISDELDESWLTAIYGIAPGPDAANSLEDMFDNWRDEWEYPDIGIPFGETQSGGHDMYYMDYRSLNENGEPRIIRIENEGPEDIKYYFVADDLVGFIKHILENSEIDETPIK